VWLIYVIIGVVLKPVFVTLDKDVLYLVGFRREGLLEKSDLSDKTTKFFTKKIF
jgi:hypothetical protein